MRAKSNFLPIRALWSDIIPEAAAVRVVVGAAGGGGGARGRVLFAIGPTWQICGGMGERGREEREEEGFI